MASISARKDAHHVKSVSQAASRVPKTLPTLKETSESFIDRFEEGLLGVGSVLVIGFYKTYDSEPGIRWSLSTGFEQVNSGKQAQSKKPCGNLRGIPTPIPHFDILFFFFRFLKYVCFSETTRNLDITSGMGHVAWFEIPHTIFETASFVLGKNGPKSNTWSLPPVRGGKTVNIPGQCDPSYQMRWVTTFERFHMYSCWHLIWHLSRELAVSRYDKFSFLSLCYCGKGDGEFPPFGRSLMRMPDLPSETDVFHGWRRLSQGLIRGSTSP